MAASSEKKKQNKANWSDFVTKTIYEGCHDIKFDKSNHKTLSAEAFIFYFTIF